VVCSERAGKATLLRELQNLRPAHLTPTHKTTLPSFTDLPPTASSTKFGTQAERLTYLLADLVTHISRVAFLLPHVQSRQKRFLCISAEVEYGPFFMYFQQPPAGTGQLFFRCFSCGEARARAGQDLAATANLNCGARFSASTNSAKEAELEIRNETLFA